MILAPHHRAAIIAHARRAAPAEACGILAGRGGAVRRVYPLRNVAETPLTRFLADPTEQLRAFNDLESRGLELMAVYHSHPASPPVPSETDVGMAFYPDALHVIVSLAGARPRIRCYSIRQGVAVGEPLFTR